MDKELEARALAINTERQELQKKCSELADQADAVAGEIQNLIDDAEDVDGEDIDTDFDLEEHEAAYSNVVAWQEALETAANVLDC